MVEADILADVVKDTTAKEEGIDLVKYSKEEVAAYGNPVISNEKLVVEFDAIGEVVGGFNEASVATEATFNI